MRDILDQLDLMEARAPRDTVEIITPNWSESALAPVMSPSTVRLHLGKLAHGYADRYNSGEGDRRFNYNGTVLHNLFFQQFRPPRTRNEPNGPIGNLIRSKWGSWDDFKDRFREEALKLQGSGWAYMNRSGDVRTFPNHNMPTDILILVDLWEHSMLDYGANKAKYLDNIWRIMDWSVLNTRWAQPYRV